MFTEQSSQIIHCAFGNFCEDLPEHSSNSSSQPILRMCSPTPMHYCTSQPHVIDFIRAIKVAAGGELGAK